ncbi:MAG: serine/threonine protein kinase [Deltaproteobacteria bacterium]|nr:serine/threonine protein kinase [Deltaproteobacteria bacterium]
MNRQTLLGSPAIIIPPRFASQRGDAPAQTTRVPELEALPPEDALFDARERWAENQRGRILNGRYRLESALGFGMTGAVFRGVRLGLDRPVAIKILDESLRANPDLRARFEREAHTASRLRHPNCVGITDVDEDEELSYFVMPLIDGFELAEMLGTPLPTEQAVSITRQLLEALAHAHALGIVHRDIKPENVLVVEGRSGQHHIKLLDFGIAKVTAPADDRCLTRMGQVFGTPQYMSPEQAKGMGVGPQSDLYSTGLILFELLTGHPPFESDDPMELLTMHLREPVPSLRGRVDDAVVDVVERLVAKDPAHRFGSALAAVEALAALGSASTSSSSSPSVAGSVEPRPQPAPLPSPSTLPRVIIDPRSHVGATRLTSTVQPRRMHVQMQSRPCPVVMHRQRRELAPVVGAAALVVVGWFALAMTIVG